jgi:hypothetical protein
VCKERGIDITTQFIVISYTTPLLYHHIPSGSFCPCLGPPLSLSGSARPASIPRGRIFASVPRPFRVRPHLHPVACVWEALRDIYIHTECLETARPRIRRVNRRVCSHYTLFTHYTLHTHTHTPAPAVNRGFCLICAKNPCSPGSTAASLEEEGKEEEEEEEERGVWLVLVSLVLLVFPSLRSDSMRFTCAEEEGEEAESPRLLTAHNDVHSAAARSMMLGWIVRRRVIWELRDITGLDPRKGALRKIFPR